MSVALGFSQLHVLGVHILNSKTAFISGSPCKGMPWKSVCLMNLS